MDTIKLLKALNQKGNLALFVGAGVSKSCGMPDWNELTSELAYRLLGIQELDGFFEANNLRIARALRRQAGDNFEKLVEDYLYEKNVDFSELILSIPETGINRICTFNFDDLLESAFRMQGQKPEVLLPGDKYDHNRDNPIIFHPHGFLDGSIDSTNIVFSEQEYHDLYSDPYGWANLVQINLLMNYSVLFVGMSITDPNIRRLIDSVSKVANNRHFAIFSKKECPVYTSSLTNDLVSFGIEPVWVEDYEGVTTIFRQIKKVRSNQRKRLGNNKNMTEKKVKKNRQVEKGLKRVNRILKKT